MRDQSTTQNPQEAMTTEEFHRLLQENIERHADERKRHQGELSRSTERLASSGSVRRRVTMRRCVASRSSVTSPAAS